MPFTFSVAEYADMVLHTVLTLVMQFMLKQNTSNMPQTVEYHTESVYSSLLALQDTCPRLCYS